MTTEHRINTQSIPIACTLSPSELSQRALSVRATLAAAEERTELAGGYAFRYPGTREWIAQLSAMIAAERECCRFFRFSLTFEPDLGPVWLHVDGAEGVKDFVRDLTVTG